MRRQVLLLFFITQAIVLQAQSEKVVKYLKRFDKATTLQVIERTNGLKLTKEQYVGIAQQMQETQELLLAQYATANTKTRQQTIDSLKQAEWSTYISTIGEDTFKKLCLKKTRNATFV